MTVRNWVQSFNNSPGDQSTLLAQNRTIIRALKDCIKLAGYTVYYSCGDNGAGVFTAGVAGDGVDRWGANNALTWATAGSNHSWIVLQRGAGQLPNSKTQYVLLDLANATANSFIRQTSSTVYSGGSATAAPTATTANRIIFGGGATQVTRTPVVNHKYSFEYSDAGDWIFWVSVDGTGRIPFGSCSLITGSTTYESGLNYPTFNFQNYSDDATGGAFKFTNLQSIGSVGMFRQNDTVETGGNAAGIETLTGPGGASIAGSYTNTGSAISGKLPMWPIPIGMFSAGNLAPYGTLVDVWAGPSGSGINQGDTNPLAPAAAQYIMVGNLWVPTNNTGLQL